MTPLQLQAELKKRVEKVVKNLLLNSSSGDRKSIKVFEQHLPAKRKSENRNTPDNDYPCVIVYLDEGEQTSGVGESTATIYFGIGVFDDSDDNQGYRDCMMVTEKIRQDLVKNPLISNRFELKFPLKWKYSDEDNGPFHFAWIESVFDVPSIVREDVEAMI